jgi:hypothetical protein
MTMTMSCEEMVGERERVYDDLYRHSNFDVNLMLYTTVTIKMMKKSYIDRFFINQFSETKLQLLRLFFSILVMYCLIRKKEI